MSTFLLKHFPGVRGKKTTLALQERQSECEMIEQILNQIHEQDHDPIKHFLDQASLEDSNHPSNDEIDGDDNELPVSTYSDYSIVFDATAETTRSLAILKSSVDATEAQEIVLAGVLPRERGNEGPCVDEQLLSSGVPHAAGVAQRGRVLDQHVQPMATDAFQDESLTYELIKLLGDTLICVSADSLDRTD